MISTAETLQEFVDSLFQNIDEDAGKAIIMTPINKNMHKINRLCMKKFKGKEYI